MLNTKIKGSESSNVEVLECALQEITSGRRVALITIIGKEGSGPRDLGVIIAVSDNGLKKGTIGGGLFKEIVVKEALKALSEDKPRRVKIALRPENIPEDAIKTSMYCGGVIEVFINILKPSPYKYMGRDYM